MSVRPVAEQIRIARQKTAEATHRLIVAVARQEHARVMTAEPRPDSFRRWVDGREGAPEEAVRPAGVIVYQYRRLEVVVRFALETLKELSPSGPPLGGHYREQHMLTVGGAPAVDLSGWRPGEEILISNPMPYSRKIELGTMTMRVPGSDRVYAQAEQVVRGRYGSIAQVSFTWRGGTSKTRVPALVIRAV